MDSIVHEFKLAMRRQASTVAIVTTGIGDHWSGMAATAVTSVAVDPPTILVAVNRTASILPVLHAEQRFCVNLLAERHQDLVAVFSGGRKGMDRFGIGDWSGTPEGLPVLSDALASLVCITKTTLDVETHTLFIGNVQSIVNHPQIEPLLWVDGKFASARVLQAA